MPDSALTAVGYGGDYLADFDDSSAGPSHGLGQPVRVDLGPVSSLVDPPDTMHIPAHASDFIANLAPGDTTEHEYMAEVRTTHGHAPFAHDLHVAIAAGTLNSDSDYHSLRTSWLSDRVAAVAPDIAAAGASVTSAGGTVIEQGVLFPFVAFLADEPTIQSLLASAPFESLSIDAPLAEPHIEDGVSLRATTKMGPYVSTGTDLNGDGIPELYRGGLSRVAVVEVNDSPGIDSLPALHAMAPAAGSSLPRFSRLIERVSCTVGATSTSCGDGEDAPGKTGSHMWTHGTTVTSVLLGDLEAGQDPGEVCNLRDDNGDGVVDTGWEYWPYEDHPYCDLIDNAGTSLASAAVTGALVNYREFYLNKYSRLIEFPGIAMVNALVRGDGRGATGIGFSTDLGAGNLGMAMTHSPYLTGPWGWGTGRVCVRDSQDVLIPIASNMPAGVERLRAVAFWHDRYNRRRHIDLAVLQDGALKGQDVSDDVKKRVHLRYATELTAGAAYELRLRGRDIRGTDNPQCGSHQKVVYWAYIYAKAGL